MIYLDNAATTGHKPDSVVKAVLNAVKNYNANPGRSGHIRSQKAADEVYKARKNVADFFGSAPENVVFTANCTQSLNYVIKGVLKKGDHVIISSLEHNAVARPVYKMQEDGVIEYDVAPVITGDRDATIRSFERLIKENTKLIVCTHASNVTGEIMPIYDIGELCKNRGIFFCVDAAQSAGIIEIDCKRNIDFLCIAPHKGLYAPMGVGVLIAREKLENTIIEGGTGSFSNVLKQPNDMPEMLESGTVNLPGIMGVSAGIDFIKNRGVKNIYEHELLLIQKAYKNLSKQKGIMLYTEYPEKGVYAPVLSFNKEGYNSMEIADYLAKQGIATRAGLHCAPLAHKTIGTIDSGTVRICVSAFNKYEEIGAFLEIMRKIDR